MKPSKRTQPYRKRGPRPQNKTLGAMLAGRTVHGHNPMDAKRHAAKKARKRKRKKRLPALY